MRILVTGGTGYIGSHTVVELIEQGHEVVIVDNLSNSNASVIERIRKITGKSPIWYKADIRNSKKLAEIFKQHKPEAVIHFAGLKAVGESVEKPMEYYDNNINGTLVLLEEMKKAGVKNLIFSSSATVYGEPETMPITEEMPKGACTNPYGWTKWMQEQIFADIYKSDPTWNFVMLRYFNPIGAHDSGLIGEDPKGIPNNLVPYIAKVATGELKQVNVFGNDYPTPDGTGIRDYIHVVDLAKGHVCALKKIDVSCGYVVYNLGTGKGSSVLDVVRAYSKACGKDLPYEIKPRRAGDIACCYADTAKAERELGWKAERDLDDMCRTSWIWQKNKAS